MQITSANSGAYPSSGLSPAVLPPSRKPDAGSTSSDANAAVSAASNARSLQQIVPPVIPTPTNNDASRVLVQARQRAGFDEDAAGIAQAGRAASDPVARRAVAAYNTVAAQEQRFELGDVLAGVDVFA